MELVPFLGTVQILGEEENRGVIHGLAIFIFHGPANRDRGSLGLLSFLPWNFWLILGFGWGFLFLGAS
jgi:hypothetical protein